MATVVEVPLGCDALAVVLEPAPLAVELPTLLGVLLLVEGVVVVAVPGDVEVELVELLLPLLEGVHGATVVVVLDCEPCALWLCVPRVPPVTLPGLLAVPGVTGVTAGVPVELAPGGLVVTMPELGAVAPGWVVVVPGWVVVVPGLWV